MGELVGWAVLSAIALALMLYMKYRGNRFGWGTCKFFASTGFIGAAVVLGAVDTVYGIILLVALVFSWAGDLFLISRSSRMLYAGIVSFLLAHIGYCTAFVVLERNWTALAISLAVLTVVGFLIARWLVPHVPHAMRPGVLTYMVIITIMVAFASSAFFGGANFVIPVGALLFYFSDLFVARDRFIDDSYVNELIGLPIYYAAQFMLAFSVYTV